MRLSRPTIAFHAVRSVLIALLACAVPALPAQAGAYTFSNPKAQRTINAGVVLLDSTINSSNTAAGPDNADPYMFYILSRRVDLLPVGWTIVNPLAPHNIAADVQARWDARTNTAPAGQTFVTNNGGHAYQFGQNVTPGMAPYWEVPLATASTQDLQQFDILLVNLATANGAADIAKFRPAEVEKLRRFVDGGGTLLVEDNGGATVANSAANYGPLFFPLQYAGGAAGTAQLPSLRDRHPILSAPYFLAQNELNSLGNGFTGDVISTASPEFAPVLYDTAKDILVGADSYGAGAVVISSTGAMAAINNAVTAGSIPTNYGPNSGPYCGTNFQSAPTQDLKFLCNIISWGGGHSHEHQNSHQTGESPSALPSPVRTWNFIGTSTSAVPGATINGNFVYSTDATGILHAFDLYPYEDLDGDGKPDDGDVDYSQGSSCDQVWHASFGRGASAATVATPPGQMTSVFVEAANGKINQYEATKGAPATGSPFGGATTGSFNATIPGSSLTAPAPAPTYYEGRLYASEPDGSLFVNDFTSGRSASSGASIKLNAVGSAAAALAIPTGAPAVGALASTGASSGTTPQSTDIVAMVPTNYGLYSLFLGARGELLKGTTSPFTAGHLPSGALIDAAAPYRAYSLAPATPPAGGYATLETNLVPSSSPSNTIFSGTASTNPDSVYADYDVNFASSTSLTRTVVTYGGATLGATGTGSTPALDRFGNAYYFASEPGKSVYTVLACFHDAPSGPRLPWRFRLPSAGEAITDADGTDYTRLQSTNGSFSFQGKPVVDSRGFVYALATDGLRTAVLCFNGLGTVTTAPLGTDVNNASLTQSVNGTAINEFGDGTPSTLLSTQYTQDGTNGPLTFSNFGTSLAGPPTTLTPNLNEPEPVTATVAASPTAAGAAFQLLLHTNLAWYSILKTAVVPATATTAATGIDIAITPGEGLTKVGSALFFVGGVANGTGSNLYSVPTDPEAAGYTIANKYVDSLVIPTNSTSFVTDSGDTGAGATSAIASAANGALIVNGAKGVSAFLNRTTLVTDNSRVMELNQDGSASWLVDSTQGNIGLGTTSLELNRPSSITELTPNDYLVADTGNNRVVRFDRAGKVVWELSRFADTQDALTTANYGKTGPFLSASEPNTLNQPTSVQIRQAVETIGTTQYNVVHYLVSDTGNFRILDIVDIYDANGKPVGTPHNLVWISHTHDQQQRQYRYQSAAYFSAANGTTAYIVALVTNQRVAQPRDAQGNFLNPAKGVLASAAQDSPGGSLVLLDYDPGLANTTTQKNGYIATVIDHFQAYLKNTAAGQPPVYVFDLMTALSNAGLQSPTGAATPDFTGGMPISLYIRNPRYLKAYTPAGSTVALKGPNLLLADDNGVFDLIYDAGTTGANARPAQYFTQWGFTQADYQALKKQAGPIYPVPTPPALPAQVGYDRSSIPFVPQSIQRTATDTVTDAAAAQHNIGHYLITNGYSKGNAADLNDPTAFGGEVFELAVPSVATGGPSTLATDLFNMPLGRITNSSPLVQPTFAYRLQ